MSALDRRLARIEDALSPTEAVVRWLEEAKGAGGYVAYTSSLPDHPGLNPYTAIPSIVAHWAGPDPGTTSDGAASERVERAVRSALVRVMLVEQQNQLLSQCSAADVHQLDLLRLLAPLVLSGRVDTATENAWVEHAGRLVDEARLWHEGAAIIGERYLAGHSPLFPDVETYLAELRAGCEELLADYNAAVDRSRGRKPKGEPVDLTLIDAHVADLLERHVESLVRIARTETEVLLVERDKQMSIPRLVDRDGR